MPVASLAGGTHSVSPGPQTAPPTWVIPTVKKFHVPGQPGPALRLELSSLGRGWEVQLCKSHLTVSSSGKPSVPPGTLSLRASLAGLFHQRLTESLDHEATEGTGKGTHAMRQACHLPPGYLVSFNPHNAVLMGATL